jgi:drug/metabolite transporter (DMT)-like permease
MILAIFEIFLANLIWGFGFVATIWALESFHWGDIYFLRILLASLTGLIFFFIRKEKSFEKYFRMSFFPSLFLSAEILFQVLSLRGTKASEGGFLFVMYVVIIPFLEFLFYRKKISKTNFFLILLSLFGSFLIAHKESMIVSLSSFFMLISGLFAALHVLAIDRINKDTFKSFYLNVFQLFWGVLFSIPFFIYYFDINRLSTFQNVSTHSWGGLFSLVFGSTLIAYYLQIKSQEKISPAVIGILFVTESIFSSIFAWWLLNEMLDGVQITGAIIILISAVAVSLDYFSVKNKSV